MRGILERHNYWRSQLSIVELVWSDELAAFEQEWANKLAKPCNMKHRQDAWASEQQYCNHKNPCNAKAIGQYAGIIRN